MKFSVSDHCEILQGAEGKKLAHQVVSHCSSNKASLNRQLVLSGLFMVSAGAIYFRTKVRRNFKPLLISQKVRIQKSCWNSGDLMLFVGKIEGRNSIVLSYDRTVQQCNRMIIDGLGLRYKRLSFYLVSSTKNWDAGKPSNWQSWVIRFYCWIRNMSEHVKIQYGHSRGQSP